MTPPDTLRTKLKTLGDADYDRLAERWRWTYPTQLNLVDYVCDRWASAPGDRTALHWAHDDDRAESFTFADVREHTNAVGTALVAAGVDRQEVVGVYLPSSPEHVFATLGTQRVGAVAMPLHALFGPDALAPRLEAGSPSLLVTDVDGLETLAGVPVDLPETLVVVTRYADRDIPDVDVDAEVVAYDTWLGDADAVEPAPMNPADTALLLFTSGTTGDPKGVQLPHRIVVGHEYIGRFAREYHPSDLVLHVGDLSWAGGFNNVLETWAIGAPLLKYGGRFSAERILQLLEQHDADILMIPPTAIRSLMEVEPSVIATHDIDLRVVATGGERVTPDILEWAEATFDAFATNVWGQTECYALGWPAVDELHEEKLGSAGKPLPGFEVAILDEAGRECPAGTPGELAVARADNPTMFTGYLGDTAGNLDTRGRWHRTGDAAVQDGDGFVWIRGRLDDVIISSGRRISPVEVESTLVSHAAVQEAAVIGVPDDRKTNRIVAFVIPVEDGAVTESELRDHVRAELSPTQYPEEIRFVDHLPTTTTGKLKRGQLRNTYSPDPP